jgi:hypothetical protein
VIVPFGVAPEDQIPAQPRGDVLEAALAAADQLIDQELVA